MARNLRLSRLLAKQIIGAMENFVAPVFYFTQALPVGASAARW